MKIVAEAKARKLASGEQAKAAGKRIRKILAPLAWQATRCLRWSCVLVDAGRGSKTALDLEVNLCCFDAATG